ncbi:MAG: 3-methyl-2-oxobutanoate hydroxymethyltransferase [Pseudomonadota bacterium]
MPDLVARAKGDPKIAMLTCYDATFAKLLDECGVDVLLVGDSLGMVLKGQVNTLGVSVDELAYHTAAVARAGTAALILADMPFGSYQESPQQAYRNAAKLLAAGAQMVKLEGGAWLADTVSFLVERGVPVCGHVGLTPQSVNSLGGYRVQGREEGAADRMIEDALALQGAGASMIVVELVPAEVGARLTQALRVPTIGIGAGAGVDGQVLVLYDMLGITQGKRPRFVRDFVSQAGSVKEAIKAFVSDVRSGAFPTLAESHVISPALSARAG